MAAAYDESEAFPWDVFHAAREVGLAEMTSRTRLRRRRRRSLLTACLITEELTWGDSGIASG